MYICLQNSRKQQQYSRAAATVAAVRGICNKKAAESSSVVVPGTWYRYVRIIGVSTTHETSASFSKFSNTKHNKQKPGANERRFLVCTTEGPRVGVKGTGTSSLSGFPEVFCCGQRDLTKTRRKKSAYQVSYQVVLVWIGSRYVLYVHT